MNYELLKTEAVSSILHSETVDNESIVDGSQTRLNGDVEEFDRTLIIRVKTL